MTDKVLIARVGRMKYYQDFRTGDERVEGGGSDKDKEEKTNFRVYDAGILRGYFAAPGGPRGGPRKCNLGRIDSSFDPQNQKYSDDDGNKRIKGILVVFVHTAESGGPVIAGWYREAIVYEECKSFKYQGASCKYHVEAEEKNCVLIPIEDRPHGIVKNVRKGRRGEDNRMGNSHVFYVLDEKRQPRKAGWIQKVIDYVEGYGGTNLLDQGSMAESVKRDEEEYLEERSSLVMENAEMELRGQRYNMDPDMKAKVEKHAMKKAMKHYEEIYDRVDDVSRRRFKCEAYDILCRSPKKKKGGEGDGNLPSKLKVEVKGTTNPEGARVFLTRNEVSSAKRNDSSLFIVHSIKWNKESKRTSGGKVKILDPWNIEQDGDLVAIQYTYVPK